MSDMQNGRGTGLITFWNWVAEKGLIKESTAGARRTAVTQVLDALGDDPREIDVRALSVDDALRRFENLKSSKYTPGSLKTYKSRFKHAVDEYLQYLDDPSGWQPDIQTRSRGSKKGSTAVKVDSGPNSQTSELDSAPSHSTWEASGARLIDYPFPIREGVVAVLKLPSDLTAGEARRLGAWLDALALPERDSSDRSD